jgi:Flp pilus assembly protein TadG
MGFKYYRRVQSRAQGARMSCQKEGAGMLQGLAKYLRRPARSVARFRAATGGTTAVEFALIGPVFIALLLAIFQTTFFAFAQMNLQNAAVQAGRMIMTNQVQNAGTSQSNFINNDVCPLLGPMFTCSNVYANVQNYTDFGSASTSAPTLTFSNGTVTNTWAYSPGTPGQVMVVQLIYQWPIISGPLHAVLGNDGGGYAEMMGITAFRIEP